MFPLPIGLWINIGMAVIALGGIAYGKYESYKLDAYKVAQIKIVQEKQQEYQISFCRLAEIHIHGAVSCEVWLEGGLVLSG